jgi:hypothetical protein
MIVKVLLKCVYEQLLLFEKAQILWFAEAATSLQILNDYFDKLKRRVYPAQSDRISLP